MQHSDSIPIQGNAFINAKELESGGWLLGTFLSAAEKIQRTSAIELKWGVHKKGEKRNSVGRSSLNTMAVLVNGKFKLWFPTHQIDIILANQGDYVIYELDNEHSWEALEDSIVITVRWPENKNAKQED
ncbi:MAG: signal peptidase I [Candidatus Thiodiazotropha sp.]